MLENELKSFLPKYWEIEIWNFGESKITVAFSTLLDLQLFNTGDFFVFRTSLDGYL